MKSSFSDRVMPEKVLRCQCYREQSFSKREIEVNVEHDLRLCRDILVLAQ